MKSLPGSQPLLGEIPPELVAGILGRSYDATPCVWLPFRSVFSSCPSLLLSLRLILSFSLLSHARHLFLAPSVPLSPVFFPLLCLVSPLLCSPIFLLSSLHSLLSVFFSSVSLPFLFSPLAVSFLPPFSLSFSGFYRPRKALRW